MDELESLDEKAFEQNEFCPYHYTSGQKIVGCVITLVAICLIIIALVTVFMNIIENLTK